MTKHEDPAQETNYFHDRAEFWDGIFRPGDYERAPEPLNMDVFAGRTVLEIGPGYGGQGVDCFAGAYFVADICPLIVEKWENRCPAYLIGDYSQQLPMTFEVVTCWFVLHHVLHKELGNFLAFVARHLESRGLFYFNSSNRTSTGDDGMSTTRHSAEDVEEVMAALGLSVLDRRINAKDSEIWLAQKE